MVARFAPSQLPISLEALLDEIGLFIIVLSPEGRILYVNGEVLRVTGDSPESIVGQPFATARWWTHRTGVSTQISEAIEQALQGRVVHMDIDAQVNASQRLVLDFEVRPARDPSGTIVAVVTEGRDVTNQRSVERKLRDAHFRWRTIADFTVDWEYWLHPSGHFLYSSPACQRLCGHAPEDFVQGKVSLSMLAHTEDRKHVNELLMQAFSGSTGHSQRWRLVRKDNQVRWVSMSWQPVHDENGRFMGVRGSIRDVTDVWKAEQELQRLLQAYQTLARHFPKGMVALLDRDLRFVVCDGPAFQSLPIDPASLVGRRLQEVAPPSLLSTLNPLVSAAIEGHEIADVVRIANSAWLVHLTPIPDAQGLIAHIIASAIESQDIWSETTSIS